MINITNMQKYTMMILEAIKTGIYANAIRLPSEKELAEQFSVSRTMIRDCLSVLEQEGFITRKQGIGTIVNQHVLQVTTRIDLEEEFLDMVKNAGYAAGTTDFSTDIVCSQEICRKLKISEDIPLYRCIRTITADGKPAIYVEDYIPTSIIQTKDYIKDISMQTIFSFIKKHCNTEISLDLSEVEAVIATDFIAEKLQIQANTPLLYIDETGYNLFGQPVLYSKEYYANGFFRQTILRKKI